MQPKCDIAATSQVRPICDITLGRRSDVAFAISPRHRRCDLYAISRWDVAAMSKSATILGSQQYRRDIAGATYERYRGGTSQRHRRCDLCAISRCDVAATSQVRHRRDIAGATYVRYRGATSQRCRKVQPYWGRSDVAATLTKVAATSLRHKCDMKFLTGLCPPCLIASAVTEWSIQVVAVE